MVHRYTSESHLKAIVAVPRIFSHVQRLYPLLSYAYLSLESAKLRTKLSCSSRKKSSGGSEAITALAKATPQLVEASALSTLRKPTWIIWSWSSLMIISGQMYWFHI